ncbi:hypothetical protein CULT_410028 [[Clostridium] ultunense Esp]|nr:hypothetical protein CULT_410028 [[Clostridium] ultunense Esp]
MSLSDGKLVHLYYCNCVGSLYNKYKREKFGEDCRILGDKNKHRQKKAHSLKGEVAKLEGLMFGGTMPASYLSPVFLFSLKKQG